MRIITLLGNDSKYDELISVLKRQNHDLIPADSAYDAIQLLKSNRSIFLVIASVDILNSHKPNLLQFINNESQYRKVQVIAACIKCESELLMSLVRQGVSDIVTHPFKKDVITAKVDRAGNNGRKSVIVIDDEPTILNLSKEVFEIEGYDVLAFPTANKAIEYLKTNDAHAVVTDIMLPGISGVDLLVHMKSEYPHIPVILITGFSGKYSPQDIISMGADGYFKKPFHNKELIATLEAVMMRYKGVNKEVKVEDIA